MFRRRSMGRDKGELTRESIKSRTATLRAMSASLAVCVRLVAALVAVTALPSCGANSSSPSYALNIYVTGLAGSGLQVTLNGGAPIGISANSQTTIARLANGTSYIVAVNAQPKNPDQQCSAANPSGKVSGNNVDVMINCVTGTIAVPNVLGLTQVVAATAITGVGLKVGPVTVQSSSTVVAGLVISESPSAGTSVVSGSTVNLVVSSGASPTAGMPNAVIDAPTSVLEYASVALIGSYSTDPTASIQRYAWKQISGSSVTLTGATTSQASFTAPPVTSQTSLVFALTITDTTGATSTANTTLNIVPASAADLKVAIVSTTLFAPDSTSPHAQFDERDGPPLNGASMTLRVALSGAVRSPAFTLVDSTGKTLSTPTLSLLGSASNQPVVFAGSITVPSTPFGVSASGTTGDGQTYAVQSSPLISPMLMTIQFSPSRIRLVPGTSGTSQLAIYNGGSAATFNLSFNDPNTLLSTQPATSVQIAANSAATVPVTVAYPPTPASLIAPTVVATASVAGDPTRNGTARLSVWDLPQ